jgi:hypothetical protein
LPKEVDIDFSTMAGFDYALAAGVLAEESGIIKITKDHLD